MKLQSDLPIFKALLKDSEDNINLAADMDFTTTGVNVNYTPNNVLF